MDNLLEANSYVEDYVFHSDVWDTATDVQKTKAINNASMQLYNYYRQYDAIKKPIPLPAIVEQALWLMRIDDAIIRNDMGINYTQVDTISLSVEKTDRRIAPNVIHMLGRRVGRYVSPKGYIVKNGGAYTR